MNTTLDVSDSTLMGESQRLSAKVLSIQRSKEHHTKRAELSEMQKRLHEISVELKRRDTERKRARYSYAITPSAA